LAAGFRLNNLAFARKMMALPESGGLQLPNPLARTPMTKIDLETKFDSSVVPQERVSSWGKSL